MGDILEKILVFLAIWLAAGSLFCAMWAVFKPAIDRAEAQEMEDEL